MQICRKYQTKYIVKLPEKKPPTLLMVESKPWNSSRLIPRRLRCIVTTFVEMVPHNTFFFWFQRQLSTKRVEKVLARSSQTQTMLRNLLFISLF